MMNIVDATGQSLLYLATKYSNFTITEYLISCDCDVNARDIFGWTPLMIAARTEVDPRLASLLLHHGADVFVANSSGQNALQMYLYRTTRKQNMQLLYDFLQKVSQSSKDNEDLLVKLKEARCRLDTLVHLRNAQVTKMLLDQRNYIDYHESVYSVANCMANCTECGYEANLKALLQYGERVEQRRRIFLYGFDCFLAESDTSDRSLKFIEIFIRVLIDSQILDQNTSEFVDELFFQSTEQQLRVMVNSDLNSYVKSEFNYEPVAYIFGNLNPGVFQLIQSEKISVHARGRDGKSALHVAVEANIDEHINYLLEMGADPNASDEHGATPIFYAADVEGHYDWDQKSVASLLKHGADLQICDNDGRVFIEYVEYNDGSANVFSSILAHLAMLQSRKIPIKDAFVRFINSHDDLAQFHEIMRQQIERMKSHHLCDTLTLFVALTESLEFVSRRVRPLDLYTTDATYFYEDHNLEEYHSYYTDILCDRIIMAYSICKSRDRVVTVIFDCIPLFQPYYLVVEKICSFLTYDDLRQIAYPFKKLPCK